MTATTQYEKIAPTMNLAEKVSERMEELGLSIKDVAIKVEITYEHARRIVKGESVPSRFILKPLAQHLGLDFRELEKLATADNIRKKYGTIPLELSGKDPSLEPLESHWRHLTAEQQASVVNMARAWARQNKGKK